MVKNLAKKLQYELGLGNSKSNKHNKHSKDKSRKSTAEDLNCIGGGENMGRRGAQPVDMLSFCGETATTYLAHVITEVDNPSYSAKAHKASPLRPMTALIAYALCQLPIMAGRIHYKIVDDVMDTNYLLCKGNFWQRIRAMSLFLFLMCCRDEVTLAFARKMINKDTDDRKFVNAEFLGSNQLAIHIIRQLYYSIKQIAQSKTDLHYGNLALVNDLKQAHQELDLIALVDQYGQAAINQIKFREIEQKKKMKNEFFFYPDRNHLNAHQDSSESESEDLPDNSPTKKNNPENLTQNRQNITVQHQQDQGMANQQAAVQLTHNPSYNTQYQTLGVGNMQSFSSENLLPSLRPTIRNNERSASITATYNQPQNSDTSRPTPQTRSTLRQPTGDSYVAPQPIGQRTIEMATNPNLQPQPRDNQHLCTQRGAEPLNRHMSYIAGVQDMHAGTFSINANQRVFNGSDLPQHMPIPQPFTSLSNPEASLINTREVLETFSSDFNEMSDDEAILNAEFAEQGGELTHTTGFNSQAGFDGQNGTARDTNVGESTQERIRPTERTVRIMDTELDAIINLE